MSDREAPAEPAPHPPPDDVWEPGRMIAGKYRVERVIGKGGMGVVLSARHVTLDESVAIKVLRPAMMEVAGMVTRFLREARAASKIKSPHVARVVDVDTLPSGVPYMVMEHLEGTDLLAELRRRQGRFEIEEAVGWVLQACDAIAEAHALGIVHRDLKPGNLFLAKRRDGRTSLKVLDFGISKVEAPGEMDTTRTGQLMGSPKYMSPEQMLSMHDVDGRADIWALGTILYELLAGRPPFVAETTPKICALVLHNDPEPPGRLRADLPKELEAVVLRCLEKDPDQRFASVLALAEALTPFGPAPTGVTSNSLPRISLPSKEGLRTSAPEVTIQMPSDATPSPASAPTVVAAPPAGSTGSVAAWDAPARRRSGAIGVVLGGLSLVVAIGLAIVVFAKQREPVTVHVTASAPAAATTSATAPSPIATVVMAAPTATPTVEPSVAVTSAPKPVVPLSPKKPAEAKAPAKAVEKAAPVDPFGGSRN